MFVSVKDKNTSAPLIDLRPRLRCGADLPNVEIITSTCLSVGGWLQKHQICVGGGMCPWDVRKKESFIKAYVSAAPEL